MAPVSTGSLVPTRSPLFHRGWAWGESRHTRASAQPPVPAASSRATPVRNAVAIAGNGNTSSHRAWTPKPQPKAAPFAPSGSPTALRFTFQPQPAPNTAVRVARLTSITGRGTSCGANSQRQRIEAWGIQSGSRLQAGWNR